MLNRIIEFSLRNRMLVMIAGVVLLVAGTYTARKMEVDVFPDLNAPTVVVMTEASGMAAEEVERTVTFPIETAVNGATDVRRVRSSSTSGFSVVWVEFDWGTDIYLARQIVSEKLAALNETLPNNVGTPTLGPQSSILGELMIIGLTSDSTSLEELRTLADWTIRPRLLSTGGVAQVTVIGGDIKEYQILLDPARMKHFGVTTGEVLGVVENLTRNSSGGILNQHGNEYIIRGMLSTADEDELGRAVIHVENVFKRLRENFARPKDQRLPTLSIVFEASKEIRTSVVHATIITIVAFVPLFFLDGMEGRMLRPLGISFIVALFASMIVAVTLTPVLCSYLLTGDRVLRRNEKEPIVSRFLKRVYRRALEWVLAHKKAVLGSTVVLFAGALAVFLSLGRSFLPPFNEGSLTINASTMPGISLEESDKIGSQVESILLEIPEIRTVVRKTGRAELDEHALGVGVSEIEAPYELADRSRSEFMADVRSRLGVLHGVNIEIGQPISHRIDAMLSGTKANIAIKLFGPDLNRLFALGNRIKSSIANIDGIADLNVEQQIERPQLQIRPKREMLARYGITLPAFAEFVEVALGGRVVSQVYDEGRSFDVTVKASDASRNDMERIGELMLDGTDGKVPLSYVADIVSTSGPNAIGRENAQRLIVVSANVADRDLRSVVNEIGETIRTQVPMPEGYHVEYGGQFESEQAASRTLTLTSLVALLVIFLLLYQEFRSLKIAGVILLNLPLALIGGVASLWLTSGEVSIPAIIGFISLLGIATRNGILLVSHYNHLRGEGMPLHESVVQGSLDRLNPILMTALSSALALIPLALGGNLPGNEIQSPMAKVILGGLLSSTLLNGFIIPSVYLIVNRKKPKA